MKKGDLACYRHESKTDYYIQHGRRKWEDLYLSAQYFLDRNDLRAERILEIGCAAGGLYEIMTKKYGWVTYTGVDISPAEIRHARKAYTGATFVVCDFLENRFKAGSFDTVCAFQVVNHQPQYRKFIAEMFRVARTRVIFNARVQYGFPTVVDLETSYVYYHGSGKRHYFIPFNFYELFNYLHLEKFGAKKISIYGYYTPAKTSAFVCGPKSRLVASAFCIEKYPPGERVERWGGRAEFAEHRWCEYDIQLPDLLMDDI